MHTKKKDTDKKHKYPLKLERLLRRIDKRYGSLLDSQLMGVTVTDGDEKIYRANQKFLSIIGYTRADFEAGKITWSGITPIKYDRLDRIKLQELAAHSVTTLFEKEYIHKNGGSIAVVAGAEQVSVEPPINISIALDITKLKKAEAEKEEMISILGHEIKTPLSVLRLQAELLYREVQDGIAPRKLLKTLKEFDQHIVRMDNLLTDILTSNKVNKQVGPTKPSDFDVATTVKQAVSDILLLSDRKIVIDRVDRDCQVCGSETEIREVVMNLVSNALTYSPNDTTVRVSVWQESDAVKIAIKDKGKGVPKTDHKKIFQKSYQARSDGNEADDSRQRSSSSRGLGLYLCRRIIRKHGGSIELSSEPGRGSTFICTLPTGLCPVD